MTLTQLEYIVAVDESRHFSLAAEACFVTQPTLSMQVQKIEEELGVKIFDRSRQPIVPTEIGARIIAQARKVLQEKEQVKHLIEEQQEWLTGELRLGIIPTLAPYLLPPLYSVLRQRYPQIILLVKEMITEDVVAALKNNQLDCGLVVTPLRDAAIQEHPLFYEELFVYVSANNALAQKHYVLPGDIDPEQLWLLEEGHCFRSQALNLCELRKKGDLHFRYETGNLEVLKRMVDNSDGITILPELAVREMPAAQRKLVKHLQQPVPAREVSLVTHRHFIKTKLLQTLQQEIRQLVPEAMHHLGNKRVVDIG